MLKKTITYTDYNDVERTEDFYFNLTKAELMELELTTDGGLEQKINQIIAAKDTSEIVHLFKYIILKAYGIKTPDGKRIEKSEEISNQFEQTEAYSELFMELVTNADVAAEFINSIIPAVDKKAQISG